MKNKLRNNKGITLIALVITIIVLLILAGVAISMLAGDNGILKQAARAKEKIERARVEEIAKLAYMEAITNAKGKVLDGTALTAVSTALNNEGYTVKTVTNAGETVDDVLIQDTSGNNKTEINMVQGETTIIKVKSQKTSGEAKNYVFIHSEWYGFEVKDGQISLAKEGLKTLEGKQYTINLTPPADGALTMKVGTQVISKQQPITEGANGTEITIEAGQEIKLDYSFNISVENTEISKNIGIKVNANPKYITEMTINPVGTDNTITIGETVQLQTTIKPERGTTDEISWKVTEGAAQVSATGLVSLLDTAKAGDKIKISANCVRKDGSPTTVQEQTITLTVLNFIPSSISDWRRSGNPVNENTTLKDTNGDSITIPENFKIPSTSPILVTQGIYIEDSIGNQYVWIPIMEKSDKYSWGADYTDVKTKTEGTEEYYKAIQSALQTYTTKYGRANDSWWEDKSGVYTGGYYNGTEIEYYNNGNMTKTEYETLYHNMLKSVYKNKGFYIGRYEMGIKVVDNVNDAKKYTRTSMTEYKACNPLDYTKVVEENGAPSIGSMTAPLSQENAVGYIYITQSQAQMLAEKLKENSDYSNVTSSLMFGVQWDVVCAFIENFDENNKASTKSEWLTKSSYAKQWGNFYNSTFTMNRGFLLKDYWGGDMTWSNKSIKTSNGNWMYTTGGSDQNRSLNIYDFSGHFYEFTLEYNYIASPVVIRGGYYGEPAGYASYRNGTRVYAESNYHSGRISLFMQD